MDSTAGGNQGIERATAVLRAVAESAPSAARLTDVAEHAQLSKATTHRILAALAEAGLVEIEDETGAFFLGFELWVLASKAGSRFGLSEIARPSLNRLAEKTSDTVYLQCRSGFEAICLDRCEGRFPIRTLTLSLGDRRPLGIGAGSLAVLAALSDEEIERAMEANADKIGQYRNIDASLIWDLVVKTRQQGYSINEGRIVEGMHAIGAVILDRDAKPVGALSVAAIESRMTADRRNNIATWLRQESGKIADRLSRVAPGAGVVGLGAITAIR